MKSFLRDFDSKNSLQGKSLSREELFSIYYHNIFEYPLTFSELVRWRPKNTPNILVKGDYKNGYYFIEGSGGLIYKRSLRKRVSQKKLIIAKSAAKAISFIPGIKMVGLTGSLAMENAKSESDIDFIIVTRAGRLWTTRLLTYLLLKLLGFSIRRPGNTLQKDKLCLNIWLDENDLSWPKNERNFYSAHEILQIKPLINKGGEFEHFLAHNKWVFDFWTSVNEAKINKIKTLHSKLRNKDLIELLAFKIQYSYMKPKVTRERVTKTQAIFHPINLSHRVLNKLHLTGGI